MKIPNQGLCLSISYLFATQVMKNNEEFLNGRFYESSGRKATDGSTGNFSAIKINDETTTNIDELFPNLAQTLSKINPDDDSYVQKLIAEKTKKLPVDKRENIVAKEITYRNPGVELNLYSGIQPSDTISLFINKKLVISNYARSETPKKLHLELDDNIENEITMVAETANASHTASAVLVMEVDGGISQTNLSASPRENAQIMLTSKKYKKPGNP